MNTKSKIIEIIKKNGKARPHDLIQQLEITSAAVHRHLKRLIEQGILKKLGKPPHVYYQLIQRPVDQRKWPELTLGLDAFLEENYLYVSPSGNWQPGVIGFQAWVNQTKQSRQYEFLANEFKQVRQTADQKFTKQGWVDATQKFQSTFEKCFLDEIVYKDFYSLPKFGKTKLGCLILHGKQSQNKTFIQKCAQVCKEMIVHYINHHKIQAVAWAPHSIPRKVPFLNQLAYYLNLNLPQVKLIKAYSGEIPVAQKSLSKLNERIANARETILVKDNQVPYERVLIIDDAVGSGATLNEIAKKLKEEKQVQQVYGLALVGSYKGFEVIKEV